MWREDVLDISVTSVILQERKFFATYGGCSSLFVVKLYTRSLILCTSKCESYSSNNGRNRKAS